MDKLAIFVEGHTEAVFIERMIYEIAGVKNVVIEMKKVSGGRSCSRRWSVIKAAHPDSGHKYYVSIVDCGGDAQVKTRILEEHENLTKKKYNGIIGIRDVRPSYSYSEVPKLEMGLRKYIKTSLIPVEFILAIMEIEAWFIAEYNHFPNIDPAITIDKIKDSLGFDPRTDDLSLRNNPADDLNSAYMLGNKTYCKSRAQTTIDALDYLHIYTELQTKIDYLKKLQKSIDSFLS